MRPVDRSACGTLALIAAAVLSACGTPRTLPGDDAPTLKTLAGREADLPARRRLPTSEEQALAAWQTLLSAQPDARQRAQALRRLGDLEMDRSDARLAATESDASADYQAAIRRYQDYLKAYPQDPGNDRVLYQLARAHEQGGDLKTALAVLDQLVTRYPATAHLDEAQFRRGELLFTARQYPQAEAAYAAVLANPREKLFRERALYMQGWAQFKQVRLEPAVESFLSVLDLKIAHHDESTPLESLPDLSRADRELVVDTFRVLSLALENLQGAQTIPPFIQSLSRRSYELRVYQQLAELYLKQDRPKDAADTYAAFLARHPDHRLAPQLQSEVIGIHEKAGFAALALQAKKDFVLRYGLNSPYRQSNPQGWERAQPMVKSRLAELARHHHALSQQTQAAPEVRQAEAREAVTWYEALIKAFPNDAEAGPNNFLLAELLFEDKRFAEAAAQYTRSAYDYPHHARAPDAGYAALLALAEQVRGATPEQQPRLRRAAADAAERFARVFRTDARATAVLANAADTHFQLGDTAAATDLARQVLAAKAPAPVATPEQRRVAWTVLALTAFDAGQFTLAEQHIAEVLALTPAGTPDEVKKRNDWVERQAAAIYKQGEQARAAGQGRQAAELFARVAEVAPQSSVRVAAQFDAATQWLILKNWSAAARALEDFRQRYPRDPLQAQVPAKLALAYTELAQWAPAAAEYERVAQAASEPELARNAWWQSATLYEKAATGSTTPATQATAIKAWERYLRAHPSPLEPALEARAHLAQWAHAQGNAKAELAWQREIAQADRDGGGARTPRTRVLGAQAALALAAPEFEAYRKIALVEPLARSLKTKKAKLEEVLKAYAAAAEDGVAEVVTASTFHTAALYQDFGKALLDSQRPKKLKGAELEQYNVMLEEQAYPFEEKAIEVHELNARHTTEGLYDTWVQQSLAALRTLRPVRWGKAEREAPASSPVATLTREAQALRAKGDFAGARKTLERALAQSPDDPTALLNLGVLFDVYLGEPSRALPLFERYLALTPGGDAPVTKWVAELKNRKPAAASAPAPATSAKKES